MKYVNKECPYCGYIITGLELEFLKHHDLNCPKCKCVKIYNFILSIKFEKGGKYFDENNN